MLKMPNSGSHTSVVFGHMKIPQTLIGMGRAALVAAVLYLDKVIRISCKGQFCPWGENMHT